jgi:hypothetical protein
MPNYNLFGLEPKTFQQLVQAIAIAELGPNIVVYGDGSDGGRDASFSGRINYHTGGQFWDGYGVVQAKSCQKPTFDTKKDGDWVCNQMKADLNKFLENPSVYKPPRYYLFITNVELTPVPLTGTDVKVRALLGDYAKRLLLDGFDIWDGLKIQRLLDNHRDIAMTYGGFVVTGDILAQMHRHLVGLQPDFETVMADFLQGEIGGADQYARLKEAGSAAERKTPLADVFVDLPVAAERTLEPPDELPDANGRLPDGFASEVIRVGGLRLDHDSLLVPLSPSETAEDCLAYPEHGRFVLIGGPGQGKSTLGQYICQLYRAALLQDRQRLSPEARDAIDAIRSAYSSNGIELPRVRRFPIRIELKTFADDLSSGKCVSIFDYVAKQIDRRAGQPIDRANLDMWLGKYPWLVVFDGLDEVPASSNRMDVLEQIKQFSAHCATRNADILIIATSRPQGYADAFEKDTYLHRYLLPLSIPRALLYADGLAKACYKSDADLQVDILERLRRASARATTMRLMRSPLQVTILTVLAELRGDLPDDRWQLFQEYYQTICNRETQRNLALSGTLREYTLEIGQIHEHCGLRLQVANEASGGNDALLGEGELTSIIESCLRDRLEEHPRELIAKVNEIKDAALQRLVFLVSPQGREVGFEIRSLQEFMAARCLTDGSDKDICERLRVIAPYPYWRNVFLFAAGKCARERRHLIEAIIGMCHTLNTDDDDAAFVVTKVGSQLALELLEDETFRLLPKHARALAEIAVTLLESPASGAAARLGNVAKYHGALRTGFLNQFKKRLQTPEFDDQAPAWDALSVVITTDDPKALELADTFWPRDLIKQRRLLRRIWEIHNGWAAQRITEIAKESDPATVVATSGRRMGLERPSFPGWLNALLSSFRFPKRRPISLRLSNEREPAMFLNLRSIQEAPDASLALLSAPVNNSLGWFLTAQAATFFAEPTKERLGTFIKQLAGRTLTKAKKACLKWMPWPMEACFSAAAKGYDLHLLAERVLAGSLGSGDEWRSQESEWLTKGLRFEDIEKGIIQDELTLGAAWRDFDLTIIPEVCAAPGFLDAILTKIIFLYENNPNAPGRPFLARLFVNLLEIPAFPYGPQIPELTVCPRPDLLRECTELCEEHFSYSSILQALPLPEPISDEWLSEIEWMSFKSHYVTWSPEFENQNLMNGVLQGYIAKPSRVGLLKWLRAFASCGVLSGEIPAHLLELGEDDTAEVKECKICLQLAQCPLTSAEIPAMADRIAEQIRSPKTGSMKSLFLVLESYRGQEWTTHLLLLILKKIERERFDQFQQACVRFLTEQITVRRSQLHKREQAARLGLEAALGTIEIPSVS